LWCWNPMSPPPFPVQGKQMRPCAHWRELYRNIVSAGQFEGGVFKTPARSGGRLYPSEEPHLDSGALLLLSSPRRGGEGGEALDGNVSNTWQDGGQVVADRNLHPAAALHDRQNRRHLRSGLLAADVDPVLPAQRHGTHRVLRQIVAQLQFRVLQEACELLPQGGRVVCRLPQRARR